MSPHLAALLAAVAAAAILLIALKHHVGNRRVAAFDAEVSAAVERQVASILAGGRS